MGIPLQHGVAADCTGTDAILKWRGPSPEESRQSHN